MGSARRHPPPQAAGAAGGSALPGLGRASSEQPCGSQAQGRRARHHGGPAGFGVRGEAGAEGVPLPGQGVLTPQPLPGLLVGRRHPPSLLRPFAGTALAEAATQRRDCGPGVRDPPKQLGGPAGPAGGCGWVAGRGCALPGRRWHPGTGSAALPARCPLGQGQGGCRGMRAATGSTRTFFRQEHIWRRAHLVRGAAATAGAWLTPARVRGQGCTGATAHRAAASTRAPALGQEATASPMGRHGAGEGSEQRHCQGSTVPSRRRLTLPRTAPPAPGRWHGGAEAGTALACCQLSRSASTGAD